ncbi:MAG: RNA polymerase sigma factor [Pirellulaceae bacterium]
MSLDELEREDAFVPERAIDSGPRPDEQTERQDILDAMHRIIDSDLTDKQRKALVAALRGMSFDEIARQMSTNRNALFKLTHDARIRLRERLAAAGYESEDILAAFQR